MISGVRDRAVGSADLLGNSGMPLGEALDVGFVDEGLGVGRLRQAIARPVEERVDDDRLHHRCRGVLSLQESGSPKSYPKTSLTPLDLPVHGLCIRVEEELAGVEARAGGRVVLAVHAVAVSLPGAHLRQIRVPDVGIDVDHLDARLFAAVAEQTEFDALSTLAEESEVRSVAIEGRAERVARTGPGLHIASIVRPTPGEPDQPGVPD